MLTSLHKMLDTCLTWLLISLMIILTVVVMVAVFYRRFGSSLVWYDEVASVLMAWITITALLLPLCAGSISVSTAF